MIDFVKIGLSVISIVSCCGLSYINYRLFWFFRGTKFGTPFKLSVVLPFIFAVAQSISILGELIGTELLGTISIMLSISFVFLLLYTANLYYEKWVEISTKE